MQRSVRRVIMTVLGVLICGFGVSMCRMADFGVDPFQCLCSGIYRNIPLAQGPAYIIINAILLVFALLFYRRSVGLGTFINMFLLGYVIDGGEGLLRSVFDTPGMMGRVIWMTAGILVICVSASLYMTADMGISTYDFVAVWLAEKGVLPFRYMRIVTDVICVLTGFLLGYVPGVTTIVSAFMLGPVISFFNTHLSRPLLDGKRKQE